MSTNFQFWSSSDQLEWFFPVNYKHFTVQFKVIARSIRPLLEGYYKVKYHKDFPSKKMLGDFISTINSANTTDRVSEQKDNLADIISVNNYSKKYHHTNPNHANENISEQELKSFAELTMKLITQ